MGQTNSVGSLVIVLDNDNTNKFYPGDEISGKIYVAIMSEKIEAESLILKIAGQEFTVARWQEADTNNKHSFVETSTCVFMETSYNIMKIPEGYMKEGEYEFPFHLVLPFGIPPSVEVDVSGNNGGECRVEYYLDVKFHHSLFTTADIHHKYDLCVLPSPPYKCPSLPSPLDSSIPSYLAPERQQLLTCCCFPRGDMNISLLLPSSVLSSSDKFTVSYLVQNQSSVKVKAVEISITEQIKWSVGKRHRTVNKNLFHTRLENERIADLQSRNDSNSSISKKETDRTRVGPIEDLDLLKEIKAVLDGMRFTLEGSLSKKHHGTLNGKFISIKHGVIVKICTSFGTNNPIITCPLIIQSTGGLEFVSKPPQNLSSSSSSNIISTLPLDWDPVRSSLLHLPTPSYMKPFIFRGGHKPAAAHSGMDEDEVVSPLPSASPLVSNYKGGINTLLLLLRNTYSPRKEMEAWIAADKDDAEVDRLDPSHFQKIFSIVKNDIEQLAVADLLTQARSASITCQHIAHTITACNQAVKLEVVRKMITKCEDKAEEKKVILKQLTLFETLCAEPYLH
jgi:hypothetical protein